MNDQISGIEFFLRTSTIPPVWPLPIEERESVVFLGAAYGEGTNGECELYWRMNDGKPEIGIVRPDRDSGQQAWWWPPVSISDISATGIAIARAKAKGLPLEVDDEDDECYVEDDSDQAVLDVLKDAFDADPEAMNALFGLRVPCNRALADHPTIECGIMATQDNAYRVSTLGIINGILRALGITPMASVWRYTLAEDTAHDPELEGFDMFPDEDADEEEDGE